MFFCVNIAESPQKTTIMPTIKKGAFEAPFLPIYLTYEKLNVISPQFLNMDST